jgi:hypothetical protein
MIAGWAKTGGVAARFWCIGMLDGDSSAKAATGESLRSNGGKGHIPR